ncbi:MAG: 2-oxoglutarate dehydrogenase complex dihydrolipoyllysine-residue succinyltransferase [Phycisphaerales bacterium]|nr:2-oxoglutarate dehydrogenase complex dihydrolipoyllysine-residue succinyltransferase [Phycisphaerales bacterium]MCB9836470.1 2-oxoglutarate dehydrogenase complex dihydrolipoyllysine-residue succinyltransferase [Phycisphaera sp.]
MAVEVVVPNVGESVTEGVIATWLKKPGDWVNQDETLLELETDKITMEIPAPSAGVLSEQKFAEGDTVEVGATVASIDETASKPEGAAAAAPAKAEAAATTESKPAAAPAPNKPTFAPADNAGKDANATPLARKIATEHGVNLAGIVGTGPGGRIREQDVLASVQNNGHAPASETAATAPARAAATGGDRSVRVERMTPMRQKIASRLVEAQHNAAMLTTFNECDMSAVIKLRNAYKEEFGKKHDINLGFMSFFVKAVVRGLKAQPAVNSYIVEDDAGKPALQYHDYCDIAVAVSSPKGLVVPVLRSADQMSFADIESGIKDLAVRARDGKITLEEMTGGTFTITNGGIFGSLNSTPILNPPQSGILGMHAIKNRPIEDPDHPGQVVIRPMMYLALSYDHRVVDGAGAVRFLVAVKEAIEDPTRILLDL